MKTLSHAQSFRNAAAIVTGGASGIGRALSEALARYGASVVIADRQEGLAQEVAAGIRSAGGRAEAVTLDVTDFSAVHECVRRTVQQHGKLDYLFNNAGIAIGGEVRHYRLEDWTSVLNVNLVGVVNGIQAAYPIMLRQGRGHIISTASIAGLVPAPWCTVYSAAKAAVVSLSLALRAEAAGSRVRVSVFCPGPVRTAIHENGGVYGRILQPIPPDVLDRLREQGRPMPPDRFAEKALRAVTKNRAIIIVPSYWRIVWWVERLSPWLGDRMRHAFLAKMRRVCAPGQKPSA